MSSGLETNLRAIYNEKKTKILPTNIKSGVTIFGVQGTYTGFKTYNTETAMNNDITNIEIDEIVKVTTGNKVFIKELIDNVPTMTELVKVSQTITPAEYNENIELADEILGEDDDT